MIVLIVGPSGVGKTTSHHAAESHFADVVFQPLDGLAARWAVQQGIIDRESVTLLNRTVRNPELFLSIGLLSIGKLAGEQAGKHVVIDMGAGFQVAPTAARLRRIFRIITINAEAEVAYDRICRARNDSRTLDQYRRDEFAENRLAVYRSAHYEIDSSRQTEGETAAQLISTLHEIFHQHSSPDYARAKMLKAGASKVECVAGDAVDLINHGLAD
jgi:shikimate kinase